LIYIFILQLLGLEFGRVTWQAFGLAVFTAVFQIIGTALLAVLFKAKNFSVAINFFKADNIFAAVLGFVFFAEVMNMNEWLAILLSLIGVLVAGASKVKKQTKDGTSEKASLAQNNQNSIANFLANFSIFNKNTLIGLSAAFTITLTNFGARYTSLSFDGGVRMTNSAVAILMVVLVQNLILPIQIYFFDKTELAKIFQKKVLPTGLMLGLNSELGSIGWFTAYSLGTVALVRTVGQIEFVWTILITLFIFKSKIEIRE